MSVWVSFVVCGICLWMVDWGLGTWIGIGIGIGFGLGGWLIPE